jgi:phage shock protein A
MDMDQRLAGIQQVVGELRQQIAAIQKRVAELTEQIAELNQHVATLMAAESLPSHKRPGNARPTPLLARVLTKTS